LCQGVAGWQGLFRLLTNLSFGYSVNWEQKLERNRRRTAEAGGSAAGERKGVERQMLEAL
jgi:hypothetical protein